MTLVIGALEERDVLGVAEIDGAAFPQGIPAEQRVREELSHPWTRAWVARDGGDGPVAGYLMAWHVADELHVLQVAAAADVRRRGIGRALVTHALSYAAREKVRLVLLEVRRSNVAAIALYRGFAFVVTGRRANYYTDGEDALEMMAELDPATGERVAREDEA